MPNCKRCLQAKPVGEFYVHKAMASGHLSFCKDCTKGRVREHREANIDRIQAYDRERLKDPERLARCGASASAWRTSHPDKSKAQYAVNNAVRDGRLIKPPCCEDCGKSECRIEGHHEDYDQPLAVRWLCKPCHGAAHHALNEAVRLAVHPMLIAAE